MTSFKQIFKKINIKEYGIIIVLIILVAVLSIISPDAFAKSANLINILKQTAINGVLACGMMFVILTGGIDLSVGSTIALSGVMAAHFAHPDSYPIIVPITMGVVVGIGAGLINGLSVAYGNIPPFIITLATMTAIRGVALIASGGSPVFGLSHSFENIASGFLGGIPFLIIYSIVIFLISGFVLSKTVYGRRIYYIGGNPLAAEYSGINVRNYTLSVYVISGILAGLAGVLLASRTVQGAPTAGQGYELDAIAAVIIGGVSMAGGAGKWYGTFIGALLLSVISNGLDILGVSSNYQAIIKGAIIAVAVYLDMRGKKQEA